jgi:hypothetical protein
MVLGYYVGHGSLGAALVGPARHEIPRGKALASSKCELAASRRAWIFDNLDSFSSGVNHVGKSPKQSASGERARKRQGAARELPSERKALIVGHDCELARRVEESSERSREDPAGCARE